jgi:hypothetical protein
MGEKGCPVILPTWCLQYDIWSKIKMNFGKSNRREGHVETMMAG